MKKAKFYYSFIVSYVLILLIPCIAFLLMFKSYNVSYIDEMLARREDKLEYLQSSIEEQISILDKISLSVKEDIDFSRYRIIQSPGAAFQNIGEKLGDYNLTNDFIDDVYFYSQASDYIYGVTPNLQESFFDRIKLTEDNGTGDFYGLVINEESKSKWIRVETDLMNHEYEQCIAYVVATGSRYDKGNHSESAMIFLIKEEKLANLVSASNDLESHVIIDIDGSSIYSEARGVLIEEISSGNPNKIGSRVMYDGEAYFKLQAFSHNDYEDIRISQYFPVKSMNMYNNPMFISTVITFVVIIALGALLIILFVQYNYNPIKQLSIYAKSLSGEEAKGMNELANTKYVLEKLHTVNQDMKHLNDQYEKERIILKALNNTIIDRDRLLDECEKAGIRSDYAHYCCVCVQVPYYKRAVYNLLISEMGLEEVSFAFYNNLILVIGSNVYDVNYVTQVTDLLKGSLLEEDQTLYMGIGSFVDDIADLNTTYYQALISLNKAVRSNCEVARFSRLNRANLDKSEDEKKHQAHLYQAIVSRNIKKVDRSIAFFKKYLLNNETHLYTCIYIAHAVMNTCIQGLREIGVETDDLSDKYTFKLNNNDISHVEVIVRIVEELKQELLEVIKEVDSKVKGKKQQLDIGEIKTYIRLNHDSQDLSVQSIADEFETSISNISHYFKHNADENISTYITKIRIERAKILLVESDMPVGEIVTHIGLAYASNFIRNFKNQTGMTPGQFREKNKV